jgi:predicted acetyltransferase
MKKDLNFLKDFQFIHPGRLIDNEIELSLRETCPYDPDTGFVPEYKFDMVHAETRVTMGYIDLRVYLTLKLTDYGGHIGYGVDEPYRGHRYAARSCKLLFPLIRKLGINPVVITCYPGNIPSVRTIESLGAKLIKVKEIEIEPDIFRMTNIYHLFLS